MTKKCIRCLLEKELVFFGKNNHIKSGIASVCKLCCSERAKETQHKYKARIRNYYLTNRELIKERQAQSQKYKENRRETSRKSNLKRKDIIKAWADKNKEKIQEYGRRYRERRKEEIRARLKEKKETDPLYRLTCRLRSSISEAFSQKFGRKKTGKTLDIIGGDFKVARSHIERQFKKGMTWDNYGVHGWHIDHKIPLASAKTPEELKTLCHYTNLQPLWADDNLSKRDNIIPTQMTMTI